ncbi:hypothetical protein [Paenibacillus massiliensis]|uniref:hypothetical protein n=1 Tax=Paenibacillus massiliensis TaxID=225917 RepID=UPI0012DC9907|nr:hypothetical protein [Paenibacillus massiliensis]
MKSSTSFYPPQRAGSFGNSRWVEEPVRRDDGKLISECGSSPPGGSRYQLIKGDRSCLPAWSITRVVPR